MNMALQFTDYIHLFLFFLYAIPFFQPYRKCCNHIGKLFSITTAFFIFILMKKAT